MGLQKYGNSVWSQLMIVAITSDSGLLMESVFNQGQSDCVL